PGRSCAAANTITLRMRSVTIARAKRLSRNRAMIDPPSYERPGRGTMPRPGELLSRLADRRVAQEDGALCIRLVALHLLVAGREEVVEVRHDHGRVVQEDLLHLLLVLPLVLDRDRSEERGDELVELRVR